MRASNIASMVGALDWPSKPISRSKRIIPPTPHNQIIPTIENVTRFTNRRGPFGSACPALCGEVGLQMTASRTASSHPVSNHNQPYIPANAVFRS